MNRLFVSKTMDRFFAADNPEFVEATRRMMRRELTEKAMFLFGSQPVNIRIKETVSQQDYFDNNVTLKMEADIEPVSSMKMVEVELVKQLPSGKTRCTWCGSTSPDDERGNCIACGGPR